VDIEQTVPVEAFQALINEHRVEMAKLRMQLIIYRETLISHGIEPPDRDDDELMQLYERARIVVSSASSFVAGMKSEKELFISD
jgi:hypothetical protein